ncbi:MAG: hypothetical protein ACLPY1_15265 [Terracidiphilus sp.]
MSNADTWIAAIAFGILIAFLGTIRGQLKRIEEKIDKLNGK